MEHLKIEYLPIDALKPYERNAKEHPPEQIDQIKESIRLFGMNDPIGIWGDELLIVEGHGRLLALQEMGVKEVPTIRLDHLTDEQRRAYTLAHNQTTMNSGFVLDILHSELEELQYDFDMESLGFDVDGIKLEAARSAYDIPEEEKGKLSDSFVVPPFTILDSRQGDWTQRKRLWHSLIKDDTSARADAVVYDNAIIAGGFKQGVSLLDPVLSEIIVRWFMPASGKCFDVFAGDTVFGFVAAYLGNQFTGIELREEQAEFNNNAVAGMDARYICDDGRNVLQHIPEKSQDLFFSCPPYFDLEVYSDKENDASNQETFEDFYAILDTAFSQAVKCLKDNRFAVVVCGDIRSKKDGCYYNFADEIKKTFIRNGMGLYNELILINPFGTAAIRAARQMQTRKCVKVHQNVLVFYKGDTKQIKDIFPEIKEMEALDDASEDE